MRRQIIRLTESDLHKIIKESVRRIIKEETEADLEAAKERLMNAKAGRDKNELLAATKEYYRIKSLLGQEVKTVVNPDVNYSDRVNAANGVKKSVGRWDRTNDIGVGRQIDKDDRSKLQINPDLGIV